MEGLVSSMDPKYYVLAPWDMKARTVNKVSALL